MKKKLLIIITITILIISSLVMSGCSALFSSSARLTIINKYEKEIMARYRLHSESNWNILEDFILPEGRVVKELEPNTYDFRFSNSETNRYWEWEGLELQRRQKITIEVPFDPKTY